MHVKSIQIKPEKVRSHYEHHNFLHHLHFALRKTDFVKPSLFGVWKMHTANSLSGLNHRAELMSRCGRLSHTTSGGVNQASKTVIIVCAARRERLRTWGINTTTVLMDFLAFGRVWEENKQEKKTRGESLRIEKRNILLND